MNSESGAMNSVGLPPNKSVLSTHWTRTAHSGPWTKL